MKIFERKSNVNIQFVRGGALSDSQLIQALNVDKGHHVLTGIAEVIDRLDEAYEVQFCDIAATPQARADAGIAKATLRDVRAAIASWVGRGKQSG